jgi:tetratricopeptide (TPR) repeat protein
MLRSFALIIFFVVGFISYSCRTNEEKKKESSVEQPVNTGKEKESPSNDLTLLEDSLKHDSLNINLRNQLASKYYSTGELDKAALHFLKIYKLDNKNLIALSNLGNIYYDNQQDDKAIQFYEKALAIDPGNISMKCDLATCYSRINKPQKAIQILRENIKSDSNHRQSHYNLSVILRQIGKISEAETEMKKYESLNSPVKN